MGIRGMSIMSNTSWRHPSVGKLLSNNIFVIDVSITDAGVTMMVGSAVATENGTPA